MVKPLFDFDFTRRVLLDTNQIMNAAFIPSGLARRAVDYLRSKGTPIYVPADALAEAALVYSKFANSVGSLVNSRNQLHSYVSQSGALVTPPATRRHVNGINRADGPIAASASDLDATLLTDDIELIAECRRVDIQATQPWEVARSFRGPSELPALLTVARYLSPVADRGYVFARAVAGAWASLNLDQFFTIANCGDSFILGYSGGHHEWQLKLAGVGDVVLPMPLAESAHYVVRGQYVRTGQNIRLDLAASLAGGPVEQRHQNFVGTTPKLGGVQLSLGHSPAATDHWNGFLKDVVVSDGAVSPRTFRFIAATEDLSPNPLDQDRLADAFARLNLITP